MNKLYDLLKYIIYASFYVIVIKTGMDFYDCIRYRDVTGVQTCALPICLSLCFRLSS